MYQKHKKKTSKKTSLNKKYSNKEMNITLHVKHSSLFSILININKKQK